MGAGLRKATAGGPGLAWRARSPPFVPFWSQNAARDGAASTASHCVRGAGAAYRVEERQEVSMTARIYKPSRTAMQSGPGPDEWVLEHAPAERRRLDPLMGWTGSGDTQAQVRLRFDSKEAALAYAKKHGIVAQVIEPKPTRPTVRPMGYGGNFAANRRVPWSH